MKNENKNTLFLLKCNIYLINCNNFVKKVFSYINMKMVKYNTKCNYVNNVLKGIIAIFVAFLFSGITVNAEEEDAKSFEGGNKYETRYELSFKTELSDWQYYLNENIEAKMVYDTFSSVLDENGERIYPDEFIVGLLANILEEGTPGLVEFSFSKKHQYDFYLPSGGSTIQTASDVEYLLNWTTSNDETEEGCAKKGSCGVSSLQWSYGRRIEWLSYVKEKLDDDKRFVCKKEDFYYANKEMFLKELNPDSCKEYYKKIEEAVADTERTPEDYAEAICDYYVKPCGACLCMKGNGSACKERREQATYIWKIFESKNIQIYSFNK